MSTSDGRDGVQEILDRLPLLVALPEDARRLVMQSFEPVSFGFGSVIVEEGETGDSLYVLVSGSCPCAQAGSRRPGGLAPGAQGRRHVRRGGPARRAATVRDGAREQRRRGAQARQGRLPGRGRPRARDRRAARAADRLRYRHRDLFRLSSAFSRIADETLDDLIDSLEPLHADKGEIVVRQGEASTCMYFVEDGRLRAVWQTDDGTRGDVAYLRRGDFFGERALLLGAPRAVTIEAVTPASLLVLQEEDFRRLLERDAVFRDVVEGNVEKYEFKFAARVPLDFAEEVLPASASVSEAVGLDQVDEVQETREGAEPVADEWTGETREEKRRPDPPLPARVAGRRDGLRGRLPGNGVPSLRARREPGPRPQDRAHGHGRHEPGGDRGRRRVARPACSLREGLEIPARRAADAGDRPFRRQPLGSALRRRRRSRPPLRPGARAGEDGSRRVRGQVVGLCGAPGLRTGARGGSDRRGQGRLDLGVLRTVQAHAAHRGAAGARRCGPPDDASGLHADRLRRRPLGTRLPAALPAHGGDARRPRGDGRRDPRPALPARSRGREDRRPDARLPDRQAAGPADELLQLTADGRHPAPTRRHARSADADGAGGCEGVDRCRHAARGRGADAGLRLGARTRLPREPPPCTQA